MNRFVAVCLVMLVFSAMGFAADSGSWTGVISDAKCAGKTPHTADCVAKCVAGGGKAVLMVGDAAYTITNPEKVKGHEMHKVTITGKLDKASSELTVDKLEMAKN